MNVLGCKIEELEQYGRRLCLRIEGILSVEDETLHDVLDMVKSLITESKCEISVVVIDRAHQIVKEYKDKTWNVPCKSIMVRFSIFWHRALFYWNRNKFKKAKVQLYLTKKWCMIFTDTTDIVKAYKNIDYVNTDIIFKNIGYWFLFLQIFVFIICF